MAARTQDDSHQMALFEEPRPTAPELDTLFERWTELGWLRPLDAHFAHFLGTDDPAVRLAAALVSHQLGRGHICLDLGRALLDPDAVLSLPPQDGRRGGGEPSGPRPLLDALGLDRGATWAARLVASPLVAPAADLLAGRRAPAPLVLDGERLYLYRLWSCEGAVARALGARLGAPEPLGTGVIDAIARLFPRDPALEPDEPDWQKIACALALCQRLTIISGGPGTGKTTTVVKLLALLQQQAIEGQGRALRVRLAAPTGKAAARLSASIAGAVERLVDDPALRGTIPQEATTLHRLLGARPDTRHFRHYAANLLPLDLLVVDEASMIDLELMQALLEALPPEARLVLLGDRDQLASVEAGAVLGELCADADGFALPLRERLATLTAQTLPDTDAASPLADHVVTLKRSYRFDGGSGIGALAQAVNAGDIEALRRCWSAGYADLSRLELSGEHDTRLVERAVEGYRGYLQGLESEDDPLLALERFGRFQLLCALRRGPWGVEGLNSLVLAELARAGLICATRGWFAGRPVMVTRNDPRLGLYNGDVGLTLPDPESPGRLKVFFQQRDGLRAITPGRLNDIETVFAMTVHKSQGSEFERVLLVLPDQPNPILTRELLYTGITRARRHCELATAAPGLIEAAAGRGIWRESNLRARLERG
ncbi:exodeoxyribonuclease V subunit alpha [Halotalea alkalilenta]|nr:exodeoxyribonuclease V subunit alpha [Halotalea alkalilenta]